MNVWGHFWTINRHKFLVMKDVYKRQMQDMRTMETGKKQSEFWDMWMLSRAGKDGSVIPSGLGL